MSRHGRVYKDAAEKAHRFSIFKSNTELIESFNAGNQKFKLGANQFVDCNSDEFREVCSGFHPPLMTKVRELKKPSCMKMYLIFLQAWIGGRRVQSLLSSIKDTVVST